MNPRRVARGAAGLMAASVVLCACTSGSPQRSSSPSAPPPSTGSSVGSSAPVSAAPPTASTPASSAASGPAKLVYRSGLATPDPSVTPGAVLAGAGRSQVCLKDWNAKHKTISYAVQNEVSARYGVVAGPGTSLHLDLLVPASLGGAATVPNTWPQPQAQEKRKNALEAHLHQLVCQGQLSLSTAQRAIRDWPAALREYPPS